MAAFLPTSLRMKTVLIVDDSATMRRMIIAALRGVDHISFNEAASGLEAIERLAVVPADLVVLDLNMPDIHGLEVLRFMRSHSNFQQTPVVILTTRDDEESRGAAYRDGATLYLTKPFRPDSLAPEIERLLAENSVG
jgi:two-component system chemotaxis response regulator CheY